MRQRLLVAVAVVALTLAGFGVAQLGGGYVPPDPADCEALRATVIETGDITVVYEMERVGCENPPYDAVP